MQFILLIVVSVAWLYTIRRNTLVSIPTALMLGATVYSVPSLIGYYLYPSIHGVRLVQTSVTTTTIVTWAWICLLLGAVTFTALFGVKKGNVNLLTRVGVPNHVSRNVLIMNNLCLVISLALFGWISLVDSPTFFLESRQVIEVKAEWQKMLWRWINVYGLISSVIARRRFYTFIFVVFHIIYFIAGDRTMILISGTAVAIYFLDGQRSIGRFLHPGMLGAVLVLVLLLFLGKPIYLSIKLGSLFPFYTALAPGSESLLLSFFEPLITHTLLEDVVRSDFSYSWGQMFLGTFGQLLIVPSAFGVDSSSFNSQMQSTLYPHLRYGMASHYIAQAWSMGKWLGVAVMMILLACLSGFLTRLASRSKEIPRIMWVIMGATIGVYFYRNSLENILSMFRQIIVVGVPIMLATQMLSKFRLRTVRKSTD